MPESNSNRNSETFTELSGAEKLLCAVGCELKSIREQSGMKQREVADAVGMCQHHISRIENGKSNPTWSTVYGICEALNTTLPEVVLAVAVKHNASEKILEACESISLIIQDLVETQMLEKKPGLEEHNYNNESPSPS